MRKDSTTARVVLIVGDQNTGSAIDRLRVPDRVLPERSAIGYTDHKIDRACLLHIQMALHLASPEAIDFRPRVRSERDFVWRDADDLAVCFMKSDGIVDGRAFHEMSNVRYP